MIKVRSFPHSVTRRDEKGLLVMPNGNNFYNDWYTLMNAHKIPYLKKSASSNLDDLLRCTVWFMTAGNVDSATITDLQHYADMYELSLMQFLAKERILVERGRKRCQLFPTMLSVIIRVDYLFDITRKIVEANSIDWLQIETDAICIKA